MVVNQTRNTTTSIPSSRSLSLMGWPRTFTGSASTPECPAAGRVAAREKIKLCSNGWTSPMIGSRPYTAELAAGWRNRIRRRDSVARNCAARPFCDRLYGSESGTTGGARPAYGGHRDRQRGRPRPGARQPRTRRTFVTTPLGCVSWIIGDACVLDPFRHIVVIMAKFQQFGGMDRGRASPGARAEPAWMPYGAIRLRSVVATFDRSLLRRRQRSKKQGLVPASSVPGSALQVPGSSRRIVLVRL
jgi:hypothetical protein